MLELVFVYLLVHMITVYIGFSLTKMDQTRSRHYFPRASISAVLVAIIHYCVANFLRLPDNILSAIVIGVSSGLTIMMLGAIMHKRSSLHKTAIVASVVCFADLVISMLILR